MPESKMQPRQGTLLEALQLKQGQRKLLKDFLAPPRRADETIVREEIVLYPDGMIDTGKITREKAIEAAKIVREFREQQRAFKGTKRHAALSEKYDLLKSVDFETLDPKDISTIRLGRRLTKMYDRLKPLSDPLARRILDDKGIHDQMCLARRVVQDHERQQRKTKSPTVVSKYDFLKSVDFKALDPRDSSTIRLGRRLTKMYDRLKPLSDPLARKILDDKGIHDQMCLARRVVQDHERQQRKAKGPAAAP